MSWNYYTLVAGLREYSFESDRKGFDAPGIVADIRDQLPKADRRYMEQLYTYYDIDNIINIKAGRDKFSKLGNYSRAELMQLLKNPEGRTEDDAQLPPYIADVLMAYEYPENPEYDDVDRSRTMAKALFTGYYDRCARSRNRFIRQWGEFDRNLRNLLAAFTARQAGRVVADELVGEGYVVDMLSHSSAADFGLRGELDYMDEVLAALMDEENLLEKERRLDMVRWNCADGLAESEYFNLNQILAYLIKINIIHRWVSLDPKSGRKMFERLTASFGDVEKLRQRHTV